MSWTAVLVLADPDEYVAIGVSAPDDYAAHKLVADIITATRFPYKGRAVGYTILKDITPISRWMDMDRTDEQQWADAVANSELVPITTCTQCHRSGTPEWPPHHKPEKHPRRTTWENDPPHAAEVADPEAAEAADAHTSAAPPTKAPPANPVDASSS